MAEASASASVASLPPLPPTSGPPGQQDYGASNANGLGTASHMPPPPLPPVVIPQNTNPIPTALTSPFVAGGLMSPGSAGGSVRRAAPEPNKRALYVGGLDPRVSEDILRQIFETTGHVQNVKIIPDKNSKGFNYGFIEYDDPGAAERAMQSLNGRRVHNTEIRVNWAYQSNSNNKEDTSAHFHIFVGDLSNEVNDEVLLQAFSAFGSVSEARVMWDMKTGRSRGYGFVAFRDRGDAEKALTTMDGEWLGSRPIRCNWANQKGQPSISQVNALATMGMTPTTPFAGHHNFPTDGIQSYEMVLGQTPSWQTTTYVGNLTPYTTPQDLVPLFANFGLVVENRFQADRGFAFIKMDTHEHAALAICNLQGYNVNGRPIKCSWGKDRPPTGQFDGYPAQASQMPGFPQQSPAYATFPPYGGPSSITTQAGPHSAGMMGYAHQHPHQTPAVGPPQAGRGFGQVQGQAGYPSAPPPYAPQGFGNMPMQGGPSGFQDQNATQSWNQANSGSYPRAPQQGAHANYGAY